MQRDGGTPSRAAAVRKTCGSGFPIVTSSADDDRVEQRRRGRATREHHLDVDARRGRGDRLLPAGRLQRRQPLAGAGQRRQPVRLGQPAILGFLVVADPAHARGVDVRAEPDREDAIVALAEAREELRRRSARRLRAHRVAPRQPVKLLGVDERAVEIPQHRPTARSSVFVLLSVVGAGAVLAQVVLVDQERVGARRVGVERRARATRRARRYSSTSACSIALNGVGAPRERPVIGDEHRRAPRPARCRLRGTSRRSPAPVFVS